MGSRQWAVRLQMSLLPTAYCLPPTAYCLLPSHNSNRLAGVGEGGDGEVDIRLA